MLKGFYYVLLSTLAATLFYVFFGTVFEYRQPFFIISLLPLFLGTHIILSVVVYLVSLRGDTNKLRAGMVLRARRTLFIFTSALILSSLFPASAVVGLYPVQMAMFHLLILFYAGLSLAALGLSDTLFLLRDGIHLTLFNKYVFTFAVIISLVISYMTVKMFTLLPVG
jgi:hypothetical protein